MSVSNNTTYVEYIILPNNIKPDVDTVSYDYPSDKFNEMMGKMVYKNNKYYERKVKQYVKDDLYYEVVLDHKDEIADIRSYVKTAMSYDFPKPNVIKLSYQKHKKPIHAFSSSCDMNEVCYYRRLTFRVSNRVFVNFEIGMGVDDKTSFRKIYINGNFDSNVDSDFVTAEIEQYATLLSSASK